MAKLYFRLLIAGRKSFDEIPQIYRAAVKSLLENDAGKGNIPAQELLKNLPTVV